MKSKQTKIEVVDKLTLAKMISNREGIIISEALSLIDTFEESIISSLQEGKKVQLNDFLSFTPTVLESKKMISPLDKKEYIVPKRKVVSISVGKGFKEKLQVNLPKDKEKKK